MLAMRLHAPAPIETRPLRAEEVPIPTPEVGEALIRVRACGICRTDLHVIEGDLPFGGRPVTPGHQIVGTVERLGPGVDAFERGARVGIAWLQGTCGVCAFCRRGDENLCAQPRFTGYHRDGGFAEYVTAPADWLYPIPDVFSDAEATPLLCAGIIGYRALKRSEVPDGGRLLLLGFGSSAHITLQIARHRGCEVYVATRGEKHRAFARELGAVWVGDAQDEPPVKVDSAIVFAPAGELVPVAMRAVERGGTVACAGIYMTDIPAMDYERHLFYEKNLRSVTANTRRDGEELLRIAAEIPIRSRVTVFPLREANEALLQLKRDGLNGTGVLQVTSDE